MVDGTVIDLEDYQVVKVLQVFISTYSANYVQGLIMGVARHKENDQVGILTNLAFRYSIATGDVKISVKNAIRVYEPLLSNIINLTRDLDVNYVFK